MAETYTHTFKFKCGTRDMTGECEFNVDGKASYKLNELIDGFDLEESARFTELLQVLKRIFDKYGSIKKIQVVEK